MATRSAQLLDQLQDLQSQLDGKEYQVIDIKRSCKKVRRKQLDQANYDTVQDLQEAEEELERFYYICSFLFFLWSFSFTYALLAGLRFTCRG
jgi:hypothetical protein